jgi:hypothetical protein
MRPSLAVPLLLPLVACSAALTRGEAAEAIAELVTTARIDGVSGQVVQVSTDFTIGAAVDASAQNLRDFLASQAPCSTVSVEDDTVTLDFGTGEDPCTWNGESWSGVARMTLVAGDDGTWTVQHDWEGLAHGRQVLDGAAEVTWAPADATRTVAHDLTWTNGTDEVVSTGDRVQTVLDPSVGWEAGLRIDGTRSWSHEGRDWELRANGIEARAVDPVPQAGNWALTLPNGKTATLTFERQDDDTIRVTLEGARVPYVVDVSRLGVVTEVEG